MFESIIGALLPIIVTLLLGMLAARHRDFDAGQAAVLNRMVMLYALPLSLFAGMVSTPRDAVLAQWPLAVMTFIGMMGTYIVVLLLCRMLRITLARSAILAMSVSGPAVPFVGVSVLGQLFGDVSSIEIAICSLVMNLFQVPLTIILLTHALDTKTQGGDVTIPGSADARDRRPVALLLSALREPVVWAPMLALVFILANITFPRPIRDSLGLLGRSTGGVALFSSGIVLFSRKVMLSRSVCLCVLGRNIVVPLVTWITLMLIPGFLSPALRAETVITISIPTASIGTILAVRFGVAEQEAASILFFSTLLSVVTMGGFMMLVR